MDDEDLRWEKPASHRSQQLAWWVTGAMAGWLLLALLTGSLLTGLFCDVALGALVTGAVIARRINGPFPLALRGRRWRSEAGAFQAAARQFPSLFERGQWEECYAPSQVEVHMSPGYAARLHEAMGPEIVAERLEQSYRTAIRRHQARVADGARVRVTLVPDASVPDGVVAVRRAPGGSGPMARPRPFWAGPAWGEPDWAEQPVWSEPAWAEQPAWAGPSRTDRGPAARDGLTAVDPKHARGADRGERKASPTILQPVGRDGGAGPGPAADAAVPRLTLLTDGAWCSTTQHRATAGRDPQCDLVINAARTISRRHGIFTYEDGQWWLENTGQNGIQVNGIAVDTSRALGDGDVIRWGSLDSSPTSILHVSADSRR